ncbi:hypothetical protein [Streptomyces sp. NPDC003077]|uniref:hypothetical protein n=1 Tax=Streptomyces sp. NPDC003077 TaxID=3154443 RepID=UPI00339F85E9
MPTFYEEIMTVDLQQFTGLAHEWRSVHKSLEGLSGRMTGEVLGPLKNNGYWEGAAAPYAWAQIDNVAAEIAGAAKVAGAVGDLFDDAAGELQQVHHQLEAVVQRARHKGLSVDRKGVVSGKAREGQQLSPEERGKEQGEIDDLQDEITALTRRAITADQNLAYSLLHDVGLDQWWFNKQPEHTTLASTSAISPPEYSALARAMEGKTPFPPQDKDHPVSIGAQWLLGIGPRDREYTDGDALTRLIQSSDSMDGIRRQTIEQWASTGNPTGKAHFSISESGKVGAAKKLFTEDLPAIVTGDPDHLGEAFVGSYTVNYEVKGADPDGSLVVRYRLDNTTSMESFLHFVGYYDWLKYSDTALSFINPSSTPLDQEITWTERIPQAANKPSDG